MTQKDHVTGRYYKQRFEKIAADKRKRILETAIDEFASKGFSAASINTIAKRASISIGAMYGYFESKEALFMTILDDGYRLLEQALSEVIEHQGDLFERLRMMLAISIRYARDYHQINQIYIDISTESLSHLANETSLKMESITASFYRRFLREAREAGALRPELDEGIIAFCIDNIVMMTQFSYASEYFRDRMRIYTGHETVNEGELIDAMVDFIRRGISR